MVKIRRAVSTSAICSVHEMAGEMFGREEIALDGCALWIARIGRYPIAFAAARVLSLEPQAVFLALSGVRPIARGAGLQRRLIRARLSWARRQPGVTTVLTYVAATNLASANSLIRCGFKLYAPEHPWGLPGALYFSLTSR